MNSIIPFYKQENLYMVKGHGNRLIDSNGKAYIDFESGDWAANLGHGHVRINDALKNQADLLMHDGLKFHNYNAEELSRSLLELLQFKHGQSVFLNSGSEAVNLAITMAQRLTQRERIIKLEGSYLSAFGYGQISNTDVITVSEKSLDIIDTIDFNHIAAFVLEAGSSHGKIILPEVKILEKIVSKARESSCLLIANEVTVGFGRTGKWFGFQHYNFTPDIVAVGKAMGNGYPISGVCINNKTTALYCNNPFRYAQSHQNDPLGCAVALEVINVYEDENIVSNCLLKGQYFLERLVILARKHNQCINKVRGRGLMLAIEMKTTKLAQNIDHQLLTKGFIIGQQDNLLRFMPPLIIKNEEIDLLLNTIDEILTLKKNAKF